MSPALRQRPDGRHYIDLTQNGKRKKLPLQDDTGRPIRDPDLAQEIFRAWQQAHIPDPHAALEIADPDPTLRTALAYYRDSYLPARNAAKKTLSAADLHIDTFLRWCARNNIGRVSQLSTTKIDTYTKYLLSDHAPNTAKNHVASIRAALNAAEQADIIPKPRIKYTIPKADPAENSPLEPQQLRDLIKLFQSRWPGHSEIVEWIAATGNRPSDACTLTPDRVHLESASVDRISVKVRALRKYAISPAALEIVKRALKKYPGAGPLFRTKQGKPWTTNKLHHDFVRTIAAARFPRHVTPYDLRHTFATILANELHCPITDLRILMGHSSILITSRYVRATEARPALEAHAKLLNTTPPPVPKRPQKQK